MSVILSSGVKKPGSPCVQPKAGAVSRKPAKVSWSCAALHTSLGLLKSRNRSGLGEVVVSSESLLVAQNNRMCLYLEALQINISHRQAGTTPAC